MIAKQIIRSVLLIVVLGSLAIWAGREFQKSSASAPERPVEVFPKVDGPQVIMTYFLFGTRCESCRKIEDLARRTAEMDFPAELASHKLIFRVIDTGDAANRHYLEEYKLSFKTVVISRRVDGVETAWENMEKVWDHLNAPDAYRAYLGGRIRAYLGS